MNMQLLLYATVNDILKIVDQVNNERSLLITVSGLFEDSCPVSLKNSIGITAFETYLISDKDAVINNRAVEQRNGTVKYAVDQLLNANTISIHVGGEMGERLISSRIDSISKDNASAELFKLFEKRIRKEFEKIKSYYVGNEALELMSKSIRLTPTSNSPELYDLKK